MTTKIISYDVSLCIQPQTDPTWTNSKGTIAALDGLIVTLTDEAGRRGEGHIEAVAFYADSIAGSRAAIDEVCPLFIGHDPAEIEMLLATMNRALNAHDPVKAGIDCALHDLLAVQRGVPLNQLFGGARHPVIAMQRIIPIKSPEAMAADAVALVAQGYGALKLKIDADGDGAVARTAAVRAAVGPGVRISVDANQAYIAKEFIPVMRGLQAQGVDLIEQPVKGDDFGGLKFIRDRADVIIEADESARSLKNVVDLIAMEACDSFNLKVFGLGGLRNTVVAARMVEAARLNHRIGTAFGPRLIAAQSAHVAASMARVFYPLEFAEFEHFGDDPHEGLEIEAGHLHLPTGVGTGLHRRH